jgi:hypothetical protein
MNITAGLGYIEPKTSTESWVTLAIRLAAKRAMTSRLHAAFQTKNEW